MAFMIAAIGGGGDDGDRPHVVVDLAQEQAGSGKGSFPSFVGSAVGAVGDGLQQSVHSGCAVDHVQPAS